MFKAYGHLADGTEISAIGETEEIAQKRLMRRTPDGMIYPPFTVKPVDETEEPAQEGS